MNIIGAGLAGSEAALQLAQRGVHVRLFEMRPETETDVHRGGDCAELVCSNSLKSTKPESAAGMLKAELAALGSQLIAAAGRCRVDAGGALAVDRDEFSADVTSMVKGNPYIEYRVMCVSDPLDACLGAADAYRFGNGPAYRAMRSLSGSLTKPVPITSHSLMRRRLWSWPTPSIWMCCSVNRAMSKMLPAIT